MFFVPIVFLGQSNICNGSNISVSSTAYTTTGTYVQHYILVDNSGNILANNTTGVFSSADYGTNYSGNINVYALNTNDPSLIGNASSNSWSNFTNLINATCGDFIGPNSYTITLPDTTVLNETSCDNYVWPSNNTTYSSTGTYYHTLTNSNGCDSILELNLIVNNSSTTTENIIACITYTWPVNGNTYTSSGFYTENFTNINGCDSIINLDLTIDPCQATVVCMGDDLTQTSSGYHSVTGYQQIYILVDTSNNNIIAFNTTGTFTPSDYGITNYGTHALYAMNTNDTFLIGLLNSQTWDVIENNALSLCSDILGPKYFTIEDCCDLLVSTTINDESCDGEADGQISVIITGTSTYDISLNSVLQQSSVNSGTYNLSSLDNGTYTVLISDNNSANCDTTITISIQPGNPIYNMMFDTTICYGSSIIINGITYDSANNTGVQNLTSIYGCDSIINITVSEYLEITSTIDTTICESDTFSFNNTDYNLSNPNGQEILTASNGCDSTININVNFNPLPIISSNFTDSTVCEDDTLLLYGIGANSYTWNNGVIDSVPHTPPIEGTYTVTGTDSLNCSNTFQFNLSLEFCQRDPYVLSIPNVFTPNGDGNNDIFLVSGTSFEFISMKIFNRWGQLVFEDNIGSGWDGRLGSGLKASPGNYLYFIEIQPMTIPPQDLEIHKGYLNLIDN